MELKLDLCKILNKKEILQFVNSIKRVVFKGLYVSCNSEDNYLDKAKEEFIKEISSKEDDVKFFFSRLEDIKEDLYKDLEFFYESDPACNCIEEIIASYPGYEAIFYHRIAHILYELDYKMVARIISEEAHFLTGVDIHPGARIGVPFFIDHGTGIVIGETTVIGNRVKIYQGVTLGALSLAKGQKLKGVKRHPTIKDNVTIYAGASILGDVEIGSNVVIGSNVFLTYSIDDDYKVLNENPKLVLIKKK